MTTATAGSGFAYAPLDGDVCSSKLSNPLGSDPKKRKKVFVQQKCVAADDNERHAFIVSQRGGILLVHDNFIYRSNMLRQGSKKNILYWECVHNRLEKCRGRLTSKGNNLFSSATSVPHNHRPEKDRITRAKTEGKLIHRTFVSIFR
ncbi:uncharacterized protein LOC134221067 [Armigeres subalbatus]|uniref:uncharacterized protein LOC134221067 n=1 Tax=Armigeres subalbatus TaxID=124917 RepID=UPI002ED03646